MSTMKNRVYVKFIWSVWVNTFPIQKFLKFSYQEECKNFSGFSTFLRILFQILEIAEKGGINYLVPIVYLQFTWNISIYQNYVLIHFYIKNVKIWWHIHNRRLRKSQIRQFSWKINVRNVPIEGLNWWIRPP